MLVSFDATMTSRLAVRAGESGTLLQRGTVEPHPEKCCALIAPQNHEIEMK